MKTPLCVVLLTASVFVAGCSSNPLGNLFGSGNGGRASNAETGEYEATEDPKPQVLNPHVAGGTETAHRRGDGRYFDPARNEWVQASAENSGGPRASGSAPTVQVAALQPKPTPPPPPPSRASGIYNPSTGEIEWSNEPPRPRAPQSASRKNWWWPF